MWQRARKCMAQRKYHKFVQYLWSVEKFRSRGPDRSARDEYYSPSRSRSPPGDDGDLRAADDDDYKSLKRPPSPEVNVGHSSRSRSYSPA